MLMEFFKKNAFSKIPHWGVSGDVWGDFSSSKNGLVEPFIRFLGNLGDIFYISLEKN